MKLFYSNIFWKEFGKNLNTPLKHYFAERMTQIKWCLRWSLKVSLFFEWVGHGWYIFSHGSFCTIFYVYLSKLSSQILNLHCVILIQTDLRHIATLPHSKIAIWKNYWSVQDPPHLTNESQFWHLQRNCLEPTFILDWYQDIKRISVPKRENNGTIHFIHFTNNSYYLQIRFGAENVTKNTFE